MVGCEKLCDFCSVCVCVSHLLKSAQHLGDLLTVKQTLGHQTQTHLSIPLQLVIAVVVLHRSNLTRAQTGSTVPLLELI